jgi:hypothetical protein
MVSYYDKNINDVPKEKAYQISLSKFDPYYENISIKLPSKMEVTFEWVMNKINKDKIYKSFSENFNKILKSKGLVNINAYPTTYGIGIFVFAGTKIPETKKNIENLLNSLGIIYTTEYSDANYVFRYKISKSKENIEKIEQIETKMQTGGGIDEETGKISSFPINKLIALDWKIKEVSDEIKRGELSYSKNEPSLVSYVPHLKKYLILDGHHRILEQKHDGKKSILARISKHVPKTYNLSSEVINVSDKQYGYGGMMEGQPPANFENVLYKELANRYEYGGAVDEFKKWQKENKPNEFGVTDFELNDGTNISVDWKNSIIIISKKLRGLDYVQKTENFAPRSFEDRKNRYDNFLKRVQELSIGNTSFEISNDKMNLTENKLSQGGGVKDISCKCGWGWNKNQSEKHDEYVCHKCGTDNKMQNIDFDKHYDEIKNKYADGGGIEPTYTLNTPSGDKSRLTYLQQVLVRTTAFKNFFGDWETASKNYLADNKENFKEHFKNVSKVMDMSVLEPRAVYHGTKTDEEFFMFDVTKQKGVGRPYAYFAHNKQYSENFTDYSNRAHDNGKPFLYECFLNIRNPFRAEGDRYEAKSRDYEYWLATIIGTIAWDKYNTIEKNSKTKKLEEAVNSQIEKYLSDKANGQDIPFWNYMARDTKSEFKYFLISYGYDGIFYSEEYSSVYDINNPKQYTKAVCVFTANDIKLANGKNLNFDPMTADIRYEEGGVPTPNTNGITEHKMTAKDKLGSLLFGDKYAKGGTAKHEEEIIPMQEDQSSNNRKFVDELIKKMKK